MIKLQIRLAALIVLLALPGTRPSPAQETLIHSFSDAVDGRGPLGVLIDRNGNLYGTTFQGGAAYGPVYSGGTVFEFSPAPGGGWTEKILHTFDARPGSRDGFLPSGTLISDSNGNLYGTTSSSGPNAAYGGTIFELSPTRDGTWTETLLYAFGTSPTDGYMPTNNLVFDTHGNLYGTTMAGGAYGRTAYVYGGTVFELTPVSGGWTEKVLHSFNPTDLSGFAPEGLAIDSAGTLYGTTTYGGTYSRGTVYKLVPEDDGTWMETILHSFESSSLDGAYPMANPTLDSSGNLYGTTVEGGTSNSGTVFELSPGPSGVWTEKIFNVYSFPGYSFGPLGPVAVDAQRNLYATSMGGGTYGGIAFELTPEPNEIWAETVLHQFGSSQDGSDLRGGLAFDPQGNLYGVTFEGGANGDGTVFEIGASSVANRPVVTTTTVAINPGTSLVAGEPITVTATVTAATGTVFPTGMVVLSDPAVPGVEIKRPLNAMGQAVLSVRAPQAGTYTIIASYVPDVGFVASTSATITRTVH